LLGSNGDGVLFYPGTDAIYPGSSYGIPGPIASLRLKYWRRGIEDIDYVTQASAINQGAVTAIVNQMVPLALWELTVQDPNDPTYYDNVGPSWSSDPDDWEAARLALAHLIDGQSQSEPVSGTIILQNYPASLAGLEVTIQIRLPGSTTPLDTQVVSLDASGNFRYQTTVAPGVYDIVAKSSHWLRKRLSNQVIGASGIAGLTYSLINGDINGDNRINLADFAQFRNAFGSGPSNSNWNALADLNGDGHVNLGDFAIFRNNFGLQGDP